jgi:hypothetical protein
MKQGRTLIGLAEELERQLSTKVDMIVPTPLMHHVTDTGGTTSLLIEAPDGSKRFTATESCRRQLADRLKIPFAYFERMRTDQPELLDRNVNTWLHKEPEQRLVRTLDGRARAFLSDRYRRLDNYDLLEHVLPILRELPGARFESMELTETRMYVKVVTPRIEFEIQPGDTVQAGVVISNSEIGHGSLSVQPLVYRLVCRNGLIAPDRTMRKAHVGRLQEASTEEITIFRDDTLAAEDKAFYLKVRDVVQAAVSQATFEQTAVKMRSTLGIKLTGDPVKAVEVLATRYLLNEQERSGVLRSLIAEADLSGYGLVNAITGYAHHGLRPGSGQLRPRHGAGTARRSVAGPVQGRVGSSHERLRIESGAGYCSRADHGGGRCPALFSFNCSPHSPSVSGCKPWRRDRHS